MHKRLGKILVPVDGSEVSGRALDLALALARAADAKVTVLEVIEEFGPLPGYYGQAPEGMDRTQWIAELRFEEVHPVLRDAGVAWDRRVEEGYAADVICDVAADGGYDMVVMGSRGMSAVGRFLLGSVSDRVVHHAPCTVTIVR